MFSFVGIKNNYTEFINLTKRPLDENSACPEAKTSYWLIAARTISILTNTWMFSFVGIKSKYMEFKYYCDTVI